MYVHSAIDALSDSSAVEQTRFISVKQANCQLGNVSTML